MLAISTRLHRVQYLMSASLARVVVGGLWVVDPLDLSALMPALSEDRDELSFYWLFFFTVWHIAFVRILGEHHRRQPP